MAWTQKLSKAHIIIIVTGVLAFTSTFTYLNSLNTKIKITQLKNDVVAGEVISKEDVNYISINNDSIISDLMISQKSMEKSPLVAKLDLKKLDFLTSTNTIRRSTKTGLQSLSITLDIGRANGGDIIPGDIIDIYETGENARLVASSVTVRSIKKPNNRLGISTSKELIIVIALKGNQASELSKIIGSQDIMVVLSTGSKDVAKTKGAETSMVTTTLVPSNFQPIELNPAMDN
ncbi:MAG: hypothetical protein KBF89_01220 [Acidimicrobiia bacterium]|nr:hypothetical protein [Acidimicrobiia bacterium]